MGGRIMKRLAILVCTALLLAGGVCNGDEWPQWCGPGRDGVWRETGIIEKFAGEQIPVKWRAQISNGYSGPTVADGRVWMFNERGELIISKLSPKGYHQISRAKLIKPTQGQLDRKGGVCWSHPAFAYGHVYIRNDEEVICADLALRKKDADSQSTN
jgi:hypothetical protein